VIFRCHNRIGTKTFADPKYVQAKNVPFDRAKLGADAKNVPESLFALGKPYHSFTLSHIFQEVEKVLRRAMAGRQTTMLTETSAINAQFSSFYGLKHNGGHSRHKSRRFAHNGSETRRCRFVEFPLEKERKEPETEQLQIRMSQQTANKKRPGSHFRGVQITKNQSFRLRGTA
jgi:hypothetical protein